MSDGAAGTRPIAGWGRVPVARGVELVSEDLEAATAGAALTRGLGRSYGDASLPPDSRRPVAGSRLADRVLSFDESTGVLRAEAGLALARLSELVWPRGWTSPVLPGTRNVTLGGMVAADVHGKNHHVDGCFGEHVRALRMRPADGRVIEIDEASEPDLFRATLGGMGLTGHVLEVELRLSRVPSSWIVQESERVARLEELVERLEEAGSEWPFTVAWADGTAGAADLGNGILIKGRWAEPAEAPARDPRPGRVVDLPFLAPDGWLNPVTVGWFNRLYRARTGRRARARVVNPWAFFHPLDAVGHWHRAYGPRGFVQHQSVLPRGQQGLCRTLLEIPRRHGMASFLTVIKDCGAAGRGLLSFPLPGVSVAMDLPLRPERTQAAVDALNEVVLRAGGRIYLAKDALTRPEHFLRMEGPRLERWAAVRRHWDPEGRLSSALAVRLLGDRP